MYLLFLTKNKNVLIRNQEPPYKLRVWLSKKGVLIWGKKIQRHKFDIALTFRKQNELVKVRGEFSRALERAKELAGCVKQVSFPKKS